MGGDVGIAPVLYLFDPESAPGLVQENSGHYLRGCCADAIVNPAGGMHVASDSGVWTLDGGVMTRFGNDVSPVSSLYRDKRGTLWAAFHSGISGGTGGSVGTVSLRTWKANAWTVMRTLASPSPITGITEDAHGNIWFVGAPRTLIYNPNGITGLSEPANRRSEPRPSRQAGAEWGRWEWKGVVYDARGGSR